MLSLRFVHIVNVNGNKTQFVPADRITLRLPATAGGLDVLRRPLGAALRTSQAPRLDLEVEFNRAKAGVAHDCFPSEPHRLRFDRA
jgi:hypothetical protein